MGICIIVHPMHKNVHRAIPHGLYRLLLFFQALVKGSRQIHVVPWACVTFERTLQAEVEREEAARSGV